MPHCIIEYSRPLTEKEQVDNIQKAVLQGCLTAQLFSPEDIKLRSIPFDDYRLMGGHEHFIHVTVKMLSGRTPEQRQTLSESVLSALTQLKLMNTSLTVEISDLERESYTKG
ncbi:5-carboxymethyl-2-hydroxymuconate Delta-isomerase [Alteromonas sp. a30]|uniref:5-carboxymethyl-2-hydroxymuconate Delta-isomerase n=1 Tax=Alteromonas sp. a30 TaxID=2730917 RepID=UPI002281E2EA|nr:5-carboxymethyl-2-hydroxymuconate Delta-isomerase [Alteromonas sp. a30]MCY7294570.1 5-carboxymethyl-2-hydroxymuconate Delta-isomerase [Alteromonas sp. a30]